jgi:hypothetical protein
MCAVWQVDQKDLEGFEMWCWSGREMICWTERVRNGEVLQSEGGKEHTAESEG